ncbi:MMPL family transporter [Stenotrophomonas sp. HITSZ_GD]|uniref:MMPL family transporter n=1 Tax=Stenotrophomonas sp. HITSZ_GD TaxID=3037248 RepID=UPI00240E02EB|nr:MMPL family transporter [Stenotrophomonas sp. HITSZ_GD]MDG2525338.1 MMPL family transporter [Stenotrophomonas sp. HITSZ_GD]
MNDPAAQAGGADARLHRHWRWVGLLWLAVVVAVAVHQWSFWRGAHIDSDVLALLPQDADDRLLSDATRLIADNSARQVVVLLGSDTAEGAKAAQAAYSREFQGAGQHGDLPLEESASVQGWFDQARAFYAPYRDRLLTAAQRARLQGSDEAALGQQALAALYGPLGAPRLTEWNRDPLGLWPQWWQARAAGTGLRVGDDGLLQADGRYWAVLQFQTRDSAFRLDGEQRIGQALDAAAAAARAAVPDLRELRAGVPLHAEAAAAQANFEINTIGWGSLAAVLLLVWLAFRSLRPILLVAMSLMIGCATALSVTALVFGKVHLLTLVFGASLVGVAEDYGIHWFGSRQAEPHASRWQLLRHLLPGLWLALLTSALAYLALGLAPFPGLRQMALFSVVGLAAAFLTVIAWFPLLDKGRVRETRFAYWLGGTLARWPRLGQGKGKVSVVLGVIALVVIAGGLLRLQPNDDLRSLQSSPPALMAQQIEVGRLLGMPSPAQFFLVQGADEEQVLQREQALVAKLDALEAQGRIGGHQAISDWWPSQARQQADAGLTARIEASVLRQVGEATGETLSRPAYAAPAGIAAFLRDPVSLPFRHLWLGPLGNGQASVVMVDDLSRADALAALRAQADGLDGVRWVDRTADFSHLLGHYRRMMGALLLAGVVLVFGVLAWRYRRQSWRVITPTLLAGLLTVALLGWFGQPLLLFNVLALLLLLGMGIDYGIFLLEHRGDRSAWLSVCVGAASTWLSFGLLALSSTPALRAFGLTLLFGIGLVWFITPLFRPAPHD